jgi:hypothetical protein
MSVLEFGIPAWLNRYTLIKRAKQGKWRRIELVPKCQSREQALLVIIFLEEALMKKLCAVCILGLALGTASVFAEHPDGWGVGVIGGFGLGGGGASLSLKVPSLPIFWAVNLRFNKDYFGLGVSGDYYLVDAILLDGIHLGWYAGPGAYVNLGFWNSGYDNDGVWFGLGVRFPVGLTWQPLDFLEILVQAVPSLGLQINPVDFDFNISGELGIRVWF